MRRLEIAQGDAKWWVVLLANGTGSRVEVVVKEILNHLYSAVGLERKRRELQKEMLAMGQRKGHGQKWRVGMKMIRVEGPGRNDLLRRR